MAEPDYRKALVTGASSGIGEAFARALAARGTSLLLVARREEVLASLAEELRVAHSVDVQILAADLSTPEGIATVCEPIAQYEMLDLLVNNAGFGSMGKFSSGDLAQQAAMITLHDTAALALARTALPGMLARKRGAILMLASLSAFIPMPGNAVYAASKAFLVSFCENLALELRGSGVQATALCPGFTHTHFHAQEAFRKFDTSRIPEAWWLSPEDVVREGLHALARGRTVWIPGWRNRMLARLYASWLTRPLARIITG